MPHFVNRSNAHRRFRSNAHRRIRSNAHRRFHQRNLQLENNRDNCGFNICVSVFLYIAFFIFFHTKKNFITLNITIFIIGSIIIVCCIIQDRYRIQDISNQLSDIESDNEDTIVQAEIVDADAEILQLEFVSPEQLYNTENLTNVVLANPIEN